MGGDRTRVLVLALASLAAIVAAAFVLDWFVIGTGVTIDLRHLKFCGGPVCASVALSKMKGIYPASSTVTLWGSVLFIAIVAYQAGSRLLAGFANETISRLGILLGLLMFLVGGATGYFFGPDPGSAQIGDFGMRITLERTWAPLLLLAGHVLGIAALYFAKHHDTGTEALVPASLPAANVVKAPTVRPRVPSEPIPKVTATESRSQPIAIPDLVKGKLSYATVTVELTRGGIDARCEAGDAKLVIWRDVVGVVARRLPDDLGGDTFVDVVSTAGSTLRILPWTRLTGDPLEAKGEDADSRARAIVSLALVHCPSIKLDRATGKFLDGEPAPQLDAALLAQHDERLA